MQLPLNSEGTLFMTGETQRSTFEESDSSHLETDAPDNSVEDAELRTRGTEVGLACSLQS